MQTILAIDDERSIREAYRLILGGKYKLLLAESAPAALELLAEKYVDAILLDLTMPGMSGNAFLEALLARGESIPVIVVTGLNTVDAAVEVMKQGASEFVVKPFDVDELLMLVEKTLDRQRSRRELSFLREEERAGFENIIGEAPALMEALAKARQAMQVDSTVLVTGETGTGKDLVARAIHFGSRRRDNPFVPLSCCAIPANLVESELFGMVKGAFTGAHESRVGKMQIADGGTLFLDEIGEMPLDAQAKLLRAIQEGAFFPVGGTKLVNVDLRFICATNRNLKDAIGEGIFREDLYYRVNVFPIEMPPLRKRREDIPRLAAHFLQKHRARVNATTEEFSAPALARLAACAWPGNVREFENTIERLLVIHGRESIIRPEHLDGIVGGRPAASDGGLEEFEGLPLQEATERLERYLIQRALERCNHVQSQACEVLGTTRRILKYKMDQLGIGVTAESHDAD